MNWLPIAVSVDHVDLHRRLLGPAAAFVAGSVALRVLGLPPIDLHSPLHRLGVMDPLCGGTRGTLALSRGDVAGTWAYNPLVLMLAAGVALIAIRWTIGSLGRRWLNFHVRRTRAVVGLAVLLTGALWINQQLNAELLASESPGFALKYPGGVG